MNHKLHIIIGIISFLLIYIALHIYTTTKQFTSTCPRCNVVIIMIDNFRADALPCYGYRFNTAPNICAFAKKGNQFTKAFSNSSWTLPSSIAFFTSLYPSQHTMGVTLQGNLNPYVTTLPAHLKSHGYDTTFVSNNQPNIGLQQGLESGFTTIKITSDNLDESAPIWLDAIQSIQTTNKKQKPAFIFFHTDGVHNYQNHQNNVNQFPLDPSYKPIALPPLDYSLHFRTALKNRLLMNIQFSHGTTEEINENKSWYEQLLSAKTEREEYDIFLRLSKDDKDYILSHMIGPILLKTQLQDYIIYMQHVYDEHVRLTDIFIKKILDQLEQQHLLQNTIVIISSEHGELLGEDTLIGHGQKMYNPEIQVPLIIHIPHTKPKTIANLVQLIDIYPTLLDVLELPSPKHSLTGISLKSMIYEHKNMITNPYIISQWTNTWESITMQNITWKWFEDNNNSQEIHELYHLQSDPNEQVNVAKSHPNEVEYFRKIYYGTLKKLPIYQEQTKPFPDWIDAEHRKNLIETGYFDRK